jgi:hypothetical protein
MKENKFYIYSHTDKDGVVRYIGKGNNVGKGSKYCRSKSFYNRSSAWNNMFLNRKPIVNIIEENLSDEEVNLKESYFIKKYGLISDGGTLVNIINNYSFLPKQKRHNEYCKTYHYRNREKHNEYLRLKAKERYKNGKRHEYISTPEKRKRLTEYQRKLWRDEKGKIRLQAAQTKYYEKNRLKILDKAKKRNELRKKNPKPILEKKVKGRNLKENMKRYYQKNKNIYKEKNHQYYLNHKEDFARRKKEYRIRQKIRKHKSLHPSIWTRLIKMIKYYVS